MSNDIPRDKSLLEALGSRLRSPEPRGIETPNPNDVLFGRGASIFRWPGNVNFREYVSKRKEEYGSCTSRNQKNQIAREIMQQFREQYQGRFLIKAGATSGNDSTFSEHWRAVDESLVIEKVKQSLREKDRTEYESKTKIVQKLKKSSFLEQSRIMDVGGENGRPSLPKKGALSSSDIEAPGVSEQVHRKAVKPPGNSKDACGDRPSKRMKPEIDPPVVNQLANHQDERLHHSNVGRGASYQQQRTADAFRASALHSMESDNASRHPQLALMEEMQQQHALLRQIQSVYHPTRISSINRLQVASALRQDQPASSSGYMFEELRAYRRQLELEESRTVALLASLEPSAARSDLFLDSEALSNSLQNRRHLQLGSLPAATTAMNPLESLLLREQRATQLLLQQSEGHRRSTAFARNPARDRQEDDQHFRK